MRTAPRGGYDYSRKRDYRRKVWATFRTALKNRNISIAQSHALLMPSLEGDEIEVALNAGFRETNLHVVDKEPAVVATLKRRYPHINTYGVTVRHALKRIIKSGVRLRCANFDFCYKIGRPLATELVSCVLLGILPVRIKESGTGRNMALHIDVDTYKYVDGAFADDFALIAVSHLRGREDSDITQEMSSRQINIAELPSIVSDTHAQIVRSGVKIPEWYAQELLYACRRLPEFSPTDQQRLMLIWGLLRCDSKGLSFVPKYVRPGVNLIRAESYLSSNGQTMLWSIWGLKSGLYRIKLRIAANEKRVSMGMAPIDTEDLGLSLSDFRQAQLDQTSD